MGSVSKKAKKELPAEPGSGSSETESELPSEDDSKYPEDLEDQMKGGTRAGNVCVCVGGQFKGCNGAVPPCSV